MKYRRPIQKSFRRTKHQSSRRNSARVLAIIGLSPYFNSQNFAVEPTSDSDTFESSAENSDADTTDDEFSEIESEKGLVPIEKPILLPRSLYDPSEYYFRPYLGEDDPVTTLKFRERYRNKHWDKERTAFPFTSAHTPKKDFIGFVTDVFLYLRRYQPTGLSKDQYYTVLADHIPGYILLKLYQFPPSRWLTLYAQEEYNLECRARDFKAYASLPEIFHSGPVFKLHHQLISKIMSTPVGETNFLLLSASESVRNHVISGCRHILNSLCIVSPNSTSEDCNEIQKWIASKISDEALAKRLLKCPSKVSLSKPNTAFHPFTCPTSIPINSIRGEKHPKEYSKFEWNQGTGLDHTLRLWVTVSGVPPRKFQSFQYTDDPNGALRINDKERSYRKIYNICTCGNFLENSSHIHTIHPFYSAFNRFQRTNSKAKTPSLCIIDAPDQKRLLSSTSANSSKSLFVLDNDTFKEPTCAIFPVESLGEVNEKS